MHIVDYLDKRKRERKRSYKDFAQKAGITPAHLTQILKGQRPNISLGTMLKIREASDGEIEKITDFCIDP